MIQGKTIIIIALVALIVGLPDGVDLGHALHVAGAAGRLTTRPGISRKDIRCSIGW